jgi:hypothetical protein
MSEAEIIPQPAARRVRRADAPGLSPGSLRTARALAEALFADENGPPPRERLDYLESDLGDFFGHISARGRLIYTLALLALGWLGPLLIGRFAHFTRLGLDERTHVLERVERSPLSLALLAAKAMMCVVYFEHPDAAKEIGWDQECAGR